MVPKYLFKVSHKTHNNNNNNNTESANIKVKGKAISLQAWTGPEGSRSLRLPDFMKVVRLSALRTGRLYTQEKSLIHIGLELSQPQGHSAAGKDYVNEKFQ